MHECEGTELAPNKGDRRRGEKACEKVPRRACDSCHHSTVSVWVSRELAQNSPSLSRGL